MTFKNLMKQPYEDLKNLTMNWFNILALVIIIFILSNIVTPVSYTHLTLPTNREV